MLISHDGSMRRLEGVEDTREVKTVYNVEVEEHHTYFVGCDEWGFSVWAHNAACDLIAELERLGIDIPNSQAKDWTKKLAKLPPQEVKAKLAEWVRRDTKRVLTAEEKLALSRALRKPPLGPPRRRRRRRRGGD